MTAALESTLTARIDQHWVEVLPHDLYVPPDAFAVLLERFEGPLDFLLYLVRRNGFDLRELPIAPIAEQYLHYIRQLRVDQIELAGDYLVMAALLTDLKSRLLLPRPAQPSLEADPRADLMARLQTYAQFKAAAQQLGQQDIAGRDFFVPVLSAPADLSPPPPQQPYAADLLTQALQALLQRPRPQPFVLTGEAVQLEDRMKDIREFFHRQRQASFVQLLRPEQGRLGVVVSLVAVLELLRLGQLQLLGDGWLAPLRLQAVRPLAGATP